MGDVDFERIRFWASVQDPMRDFDFESTRFRVSFHDPMRDFDLEGNGFGGVLSRSYGGL